MTGYLETRAFRLTHKYLRMNVLIHLLKFVDNLQLYPPQHLLNRRSNTIQGETTPKNGEIGEEKRAAECGPFRFELAW